MLLVLAAIGGLARIPGLVDIVNDGGKLLGAIGSAIGQFVGGIVGGSETEGWVFDMKLSNSTMYYDMQQAVDAAELLYISTKYGNISSAFFSFIFNQDV